MSRRKIIRPRLGGRFGLGFGSRGGRRCRCRCCSGSGSGSDSRSRSSARIWGSAALEMCRVSAANRSQQPVRQSVKRPTPGLLRRSLDTPPTRLQGQVQAQLLGPVFPSVQRRCNLLVALHLTRPLPRRSRTAAADCQFDRQSVDRLKRLSYCLQPPIMICLPGDGWSYPGRAGHMGSRGGLASVLYIRKCLNIETLRRNGLKKFDLEEGPETRAKAYSASPCQEERMRNSNESNGLEERSPPWPLLEIEKPSKWHSTWLISCLVFRDYTCTLAHIFREIFRSGVGIHSIQRRMFGICISRPPREPRIQALTPAIDDRRSQIPDTRYKIQQTHNHMLARFPDPQIPHPRSRIPHPTSRLLATKRSPYGPSVNTHN